MTLGFDRDSSRAAYLYAAVRQFLDEKGFLILEAGDPFLYGKSEFRVSYQLFGSMRRNLLRHDKILTLTCSSSYWLVPGERILERKIYRLMAIDRTRQ